MGAQAGTAGPSSYKDDLIVQARLRKHQQIAVARLLTGDHAKLDPTMGDASCQVRAITTLYFYYDLLEEMGAEQRARAAALCNSYLTAHKSDKTDTQAKSEADIRGAKNPDGFDQLVEFARNHMGADNFELLGLSYSIWASGILSNDEFFIDFKYRSNMLWGKYDKALKARLANLSCDLFVELAGELPDGDKWVEVLQETSSVVQNEGAEDIKVLSIHATFYVGLRILYERGISIIDTVIRVRLNSDEQPKLGPADHSPEPTSDMTYSFSDARNSFYLPDKKIGNFRLVANPTTAQLKIPGYFVKAFSTFFQDSEDKGLYSVDNDAYFREVTKINMLWKVSVYTALHPVFTRRAKDVDMDIAAKLDKLFPPRAKAFAYDRYGLQNCNFIAAAGDCPHMAEQHSYAMRVAIQRGLTGDCQLVNMGAPSTEATWRITHRIDYQIAHVHAATADWAQQQCNALAGRHAAAPEAIIGRWVFAMGAVGASHEDRERATDLQKIKEKPRRSQYLKDYPNNKPLLERTANL